MVQIEENKDDEMYEGSKFNFTSVEAEPDTDEVRFRDDVLSDGTISRTFTSTLTGYVSTIIIPNYNKTFPQSTNTRVEIPLDSPSTTTLTPTELSSVAPRPSTTLTPTELSSVAPWPSTTLTPTELSSVARRPISEILTEIKEQGAKRREEKIGYGLILRSGIISYDFHKPLSSIESITLLNKSESVIGPAVIPQVSQKNPRYGISALVSGIAALGTYLIFGASEVTLPKNSSPYTSVNASDSPILEKSSPKTDQAKSLVVHGSDLEIKPSEQWESAAGKGISSYIVAAYGYGLEGLAAMDAAETAHAVRTSDIRTLSRSQQKAALHDIQACITADKKSGAPQLRKHNTDKLNDGKANVLPLDAKVTCAVSLEAAAEAPANTPTIPTKGYDSRTGQLQTAPTNGAASLGNIVSDYVLGMGSVNVKSYSFTDRVSAAVQAYRVSGDKNSAVYKTIDDIASAFGISESTVRAHAKKDGYNRREEAEKQRAARLDEVRSMYEAQNYQGPKKAIAEKVKEKYNVDISTAYKLIAQVEKEVQEKKALESKIASAIAYERTKSSHDVPEAVTLKYSA